MAIQTIDLGPVVTNGMIDKSEGSVDTMEEAFAKAKLNFTELYGLLDTEVVATTNVIAASESGRTYFLSLAGGFTSTLPAPAAGLRYKFVVAIAPTTAYVITTNAGGNVLYGTFLDIVGEQVSIAGQDTLNFAANVALVGDSLDVISDGTNWYCRAFSAANGGITVAVT